MGELAAARVNLDANANIADDKVIYWIQNVKVRVSMNGRHRMTLQGNDTDLHPFDHIISRDRHTSAGMKLFGACRQEIEGRPVPLFCEQLAWYFWQAGQSGLRDVVFDLSRGVGRTWGPVGDDGYD